jgi:hypothetical protein
MADSNVRRRLHSAQYQATERWGTSSSDPETPSSPVIATPFVVAGAGKADAPPAAAFREFPELDGLLSGASPFKESARHLALSAGLAERANHHPH